MICLRKIFIYKRNFSRISSWCWCCPCRSTSRSPSFCSAATSPPRPPVALDPPAPPDDVVPPEPDGSKRDVLGRSDVIFTTHLGATAAPVERCEVSRPVSRAAPLVFLAPVSCSSGPGLAGNHTSPLTASLASLTASLASPAVPLVSPDTGGRVPVGAVCEAVSVAVGAVSGPVVTLGGAH